MQTTRTLTVAMAVLGITAAVASETVLQVESRSYAQAVRGYANGSLVQPDQLKLETDAYVKIFRPRDRLYGSLDLVTLLENGAAELKKAFPDGERLQIGDTSQKMGGYISGHASHQNGLDVDLVYLRKNRREMPVNTTNGFDESFVKNGKVTDNLDIERNWKLISIFVSSGRVNRIFMDPAIKLAFCAYAKDQGIFAASTEILRVMRPWPHHADHLHVRLTCPQASLQCEPQVPPPPGDGCDEAKAEADATGTRRPVRELLPNLRSSPQDHSEEGC